MPSAQQPQNASQIHFAGALVLLNNALRRTRASLAWRAFVIATALTWCAATGAGEYLALGPLRALVWAAAATTVAAGATWAWSLWLKHSQPAAPRHIKLRWMQRQALHAERMDAKLGTCASSAVELMAYTVPAEGSLAHAHMAHCEARIRQTDWWAHTQRATAHGRRWMSWLLVLALGASCAALFACPQGTAMVLATLTGRKLQWHSPAPLLGDISLSLNPPPYTKLGPEKIDGTDGTVATLRGTSVQLTAKLSQPVSAVGLNWEPDAVASSKCKPEATLLSGNNIKISFVVGEPGRWRVWLRRPDGLYIHDASWVKIMPVLDTPPQITLELPNAGQQLGPDEPLMVRWHASDDYGCSAAKLTLGPDITLPLSIDYSSEPGRGRQVRCTGALTVSADSLALVPPGTLEVFVEVWDTDTLTGPHVGKSVVQKVERLDISGHHERLLALQQDAHGLLVDWLAAEYSNQITEIKAAVAAAKAQTSALIFALERDTLAVPSEVAAWHTAEEHAAAAVKQLSKANSHAQTISRQVRLRGDILYLDDLMAQGSLTVTLGRAQALHGAQNEMRNLIEQMGRGQDKELAPLLQARLAALRQRLAEVLEQAAKVQASSHEEEINVDAFGHHALTDTLARLEQAVARGDSKQAAEGLSHLSDMVEQLVDSLSKGQQKLGDKRYAHARQQRDALADEIKSIAKQQLLLAEQADAMADAKAQPLSPKLQQVQLGRVKKAVERIGVRAKFCAGDPLLSRFVGQQLTRLEHAANDVVELLAAGQAGLALRQAGTTDEVAATVKARLTSLPNALVDEQKHDQANRLKEATAALLSLLSPQAAMSLDGTKTEAKSQAAQTLAQDQDSLQQRARAAGKKLAAMAQETPMTGDKEATQLAGAAQQMGAASSAFMGKDAAEASRQGHLAHQSLARLGRSLAQAKGHSGLPQPLSTARPESLPSRGNKQGRQGQSLGQGEKVLLPPRGGPRGYELRDKLRQTGRERAPHRYEEPVRRYYDELVH